MLYEVVLFSDVAALKKMNTYQENRTKKIAYIYPMNCE